MKTMVMKAGVFACVLAVALLVGCSGSSGQGSSQVESASSSAQGASNSVAAESSELSQVVSAESSAAEPAILEIGKASKKTVDITIANKLGKRITDIAFAAADSEDEPDYLMESGQVWKKGKDALVHFKDLGTGENYDIFVKSGDNAYTLHNLKLDGVAALTIKMEDGVAYATFERDGNAISTLSEELDRVQAEVEGDQVDEYYEDEYYEDEYYEKPVQQEDGCIDGGVQLR